MKFSQRIGKEPVKTEFQIGSMDNDLRTALWNAFQIFFLEKIDSDWILSSNLERFLRHYGLTFLNSQ